jgi:hypothetical protein
MKSLLNACKVGLVNQLVKPGAQLDAALAFVLGIAICKRMPDSIVWMVPLAAAPPVIVLAWIGADTMGLILYTLLVLCMVCSNGRKLYAVMFMLSLGLEIYGTAIGNWEWLHEVPVTGWTTMNPPLAAGTFYCMLDMLVVTTMGLLQRRLSVQPGNAGN